MYHFIILGLALLCSGIAIHTFTTYPLSLWILRHFVGNRVDRPTQFEFPSIAICVSAYNEGKSIRAKLENLLQIISVYPGSASAHIYNDFSSDDTGKIVDAYADRMTVIQGSQRSGKSAGMNALLSDLDADLVVFSDANVTIDDDALSVFASFFENPAVGCVCGSLEYYDSETGAAAQTSSLYWRLEETIKQLESDTGSVIGADGSLFAIRRSLFRAVPHDIMDDFFTSLSILCDGYEVKRSGGAKAYERAAQHSVEEFSRKKRIACRAVNCCRHLQSRLSTKNIGLINRYKLISHKYLRWTAAAWLIAAAIFFQWFFIIQWGVARGGSLGILMILAFGLGDYFKFPVFRQLAEMLRSFGGAGLGVIHSLRGHRYQTWEPASTARNDGTATASTAMSIKTRFGDPPTC